MSRLQNIFAMTFNGLIVSGTTDVVSAIKRQALKMKIKKMKMRDF